jgi:hypothetical protein
MSAATQSPTASKKALIEALFLRWDRCNAELEALNAEFADIDAADLPIEEFAQRWRANRDREAQIFARRAEIVAAIQAANEASELGGDPGSPEAVAAGWKDGEPPRDGSLYCGIGRVVWTDEHGGESYPFVGPVRYAKREDWEGWLDQNDLVVAIYPNEQVHFAAWIELPTFSQEGGAS